MAKNEREWWSHWASYLDGIEIPDDWEDSTYHNDELPSFRVADLHIWINQPEHDGRVDGTEGWRFAVQRTNDDGEIVYEDKADNDLLRTEEFSELIAFVGARHDERTTK